MLNLVIIKRIAVAALALAGSVVTTSAQAQAVKPTIVLVHGAFADSSSWNGVVSILKRDGYPVIAAPNPLRGVRSDADIVKALIQSLEGDVVLVGHSYGGSVISAAGDDQVKVKALVFVAAFAPDTGETALALSSKFPGSTLGAALSPPVKLGSGFNDLYIQRDKFHAQFAADVPGATAGLMAAGQRPIADAALSEPAGEPAWKTVPSWFIYGDADKNIPPASMGFMAERAKSRQTIVIKGASHVVMVSHAAEVAALVERAASNR